ncbi:carboxypeptidase-like regulatory domain-containing protein [Fulvivirga sp. M361]|uniref:TonB-dependent receptor n=1 Tax=Fulvivirga sp. M361 TaxID=2594266 RepID=UPI00117A81AB|nr:carboxypeptidase-like regulatory domain-containing protein [Fulvivirga sp. M361]TRX59993.1 carboxypeptidase-like regulatory domain-containing protein [Fulvivirga sp. M361]
MSKARNLLIITIVMCQTNVLAQIEGRIKGQVTDKASGEPLSFVTVHIKNTDPPKGVVTDPEGKFLLEHVPVGRYTIEFSFLGYDPIVLKEILVTSGKDVVLHAALQESVVTLSEVVVKPKIEKNEPVNPLSGINARMLSVEEAKRYAGGFDDPARLAASFAGVSSGIQSNGIVVRGNNPQSLLWRMENVEIANPNHFADLSVFGGGGLTALSSQMLANSDFLTGAFPSAYNNAISGVFDLSMRSGNSDERENTFQLGLIGIDLASEGPFKRGGKATYLFNYRYSTLALLKPVLPEEAEGIKYQDLSYKFQLPTEKTGIFSVWGIGLLDKSGQKAEDDPVEWEYESDQFRQDVDQYMGASGIKHTIYTGSKTYIESDLALTTSGLDLTTHKTNVDLEETLDEVINTEDWNIVFQSQINSKLSKGHTNQTGFRATFLNYNLLLQNVETNVLETVVDEKGSSGLFSVYSQSQFNISSSLSVLAGVNVQYFALNEQTLPEPRLSVEWNSGKNHSFGLGYGLHSRVEKLNYYLNKDINGVQRNKDMGLTRAHHMVGSYNLQMNENLRLKVEPYYQKLFDVPVIEGSSFSFINLKNDWFINDELVNEGEGRNYGIDLTLERFLSKGYYFLLTSSFYRSEYKGGDGEWRNTAFDRGYVGNVLFGKEWFLGAAKSNILGLNIRAGYQGGQRFTPVNFDASIENRDVIELEHQAYQGQLDPSLVLHFSATFRINKPKRSSVWTLSLINASMTEEFEEFDYNFQTNTIDKISEALIIPNLSYKIEF